jgi:hypothetical protein
MNLREGTRRLALLLGVAGAIAGGFASYDELQTVLYQKEFHNKFEQLAASDVVQQERKYKLVGIRYFDPQTGEEIQGWEQPSNVGKGGIKAIRWDKDYRVESIETEDGLTYYLNPAPAAWLYLLIALFPILGFFIPWGAVRAIGWVRAGFFRPSK